LDFGLLDLIWLCTKRLLSSCFRRRNSRLNFLILPFIQLLSKLLMFVLLSVNCQNWGLARLLIGVSLVLLWSLLRLRTHGSQLLVKLKNFILLANIMLLLAVYPKHTGVSNEMQTEVPCLLVKLSVVLVHSSDLAKVTRPCCFGVSL